MYYTLFHLSEPQPVSLENVSFTLLDGCPGETTEFNKEYRVFVTWPESEIGAKPVRVSCPCGELNATQYGHPNITRVCGGSYTYGAEWEEFDASGCDYNNNTFKLCSVTQVSIGITYIRAKFQW